MTKNDLVIATAEFINEKFNENVSHTYGVEQMFVVDVNKFLEDLIEDECILNEQGRERMFQDVLEEIKNFNAPIECDGYKITDISVYDGEITFMKEDDEMED